MYMHIQVMHAFLGWHLRGHIGHLHWQSRLAGPQPPLHIIISLVSNPSLSVVKEIYVA